MEISFECLQKAADHGEQLVRGARRELLAPTATRDALDRAMFECSALAPHVVLLSSHLLCALFAFNTRTCLVVDVASAETLNFPVSVNRGS